MLRKFPEGSERLEDGSYIRDISFLDICHPKVRKLYKIWEEKKQQKPDNHLPARADFDPVDMVDLLPHIFLVDQTADTKEYRYRLVGTEEVMFRGSDPTGKLVREAYAAETPEAALKNYDYIFQNRLPLFNICEFPGIRGIVEDQTLFLPLAGNGLDVDVALCMSIQILPEERQILSMQDVVAKSENASQAAKI